MILPGRMRDADLAEHLAGKVQHRKGVAVAGRIELGPVSHRAGLSRPPLHFAARQG
jgi:hypothetical protein